MNGIKVVKTIVGGAASVAGAGAGSVTIATITTPASGILGAIGLTTTTTVAVPVAGVVAVAGLVGYGVYKGVQFARDEPSP